MDRSEALHDLIDELHITSLDESEVDTALHSLISDDGGSAGSGPGCADGLSVGEETSSNSAFSAEILAALAVPCDGTPREGLSALEARLRLSEAMLPIPARSFASDVTKSQQQQLTMAVRALAEEHTAQAQKLAELKSEAELRNSVGRMQHAVTDAGTAGKLATAVFRLQMSDLTISEAQCVALREKPEDELNIREWVQLRFFEARTTHKAESERLRLEVEALRENIYAAQTRAERAERQLARRDATATDLTQELSRQHEQAHAHVEQVTAELRARERDVSELKEKGLRFDEVFREKERLREEAQSLREAISAQSSAQQKLTKEHLDCSERVLHLEAEHRLLQKDAEGHEKRARLLEETLTRRDDEAAELRSKVSALKEKKRELARKAAQDQVGAANEVRDHVDTEIKRFQEQARTDLEVVRTNLNALHEKEVHMLEERISANNARTLELQRRLEDEEHAHQALQLSAARVRGDLQSEITELRGAVKLRAFEAERAALIHEEISSSRQQLEVENEQLRQQVEVLRKEYYTLEVQHREGRATERAELASLREQLGSYLEVERELDAAIRTCAAGVATAPQRSAEGEAPTTQSVDEALLLGTTLASAPTSAQRRIQQSLLLAQELQRRTRELAQVRAALSDLEAEAERLREELGAARREQHYSSEPQAYLLEALRRREQEVVELQRQLRGRDVELDRSRQQAERAVSARIQVEEDLKSLLAQRQHLDGLRAVLGCQGDMVVGNPQVGAGPGDADSLVPRAEHRGRAPNQHPQGARGPVLAGSGFESSDRPPPDVGGPAWYRTLRNRLDASRETQGVH